MYGYQTALFALQNRASLAVDGGVVFLPHPDAVSFIRFSISL
jgi:hypothetical protein